MRVRVLADPDAVAEAGAAEVAALLAGPGAEVTVALAGGRTPRAMYARLAARPELQWRRAHLLLGDERALPDGHPERNRAMVDATLVAPLGLRADHVHWPDAARPDLEAAAAEYAQTLLGLAGDPPQVDLVILGMGADGHTASLFPGRPVGSEAWVAATTAPAQTPAPRRISLGYATLRRARRLLVLVTGADKAARLAEVLSGPGPLPLQTVLHESKGEAVVLVDRAAAARLPLTDEIEGRSDD